jgi:uncharacterized protein (DUF488 family)
MAYPSLKLYLNRNQRQSYSRVINIELTDYKGLIEEIKAHLIHYDESLLNRIGEMGSQSEGFRHDEF